MLSIAQTAIAGFLYYAALSAGAYYRKDAQVGEWFGGLSTWLGLCGEVRERAFSQLFRGFTPDGKGALVQNANDKKRQAAYDFTFSVPKSVSLLWALVAREKQILIEQAILKAVRTVLEKIEKELCYSRRGHGGKELERVQVAFALFLHCLSRSNEPQLHVHAELFNLGLRRDGTTGAILTKPIFQQKMALGRLFREMLANLLERDLGIPIERSKDGFSIQGVPGELCQAFSSRRKQIVAALKERGESGAVPSKKACLATRVSKQNVDMDALFAGWADTAKTLGFDRGSAEKLFGSRVLAREKAQAAVSTTPAGTETTLVSSRVMTSAGEFARAAHGQNFDPAIRVTQKHELELGSEESANSLQQRENVQVDLAKSQSNLSEQRVQREADLDPWSQFKPLAKNLSSTTSLKIEKTATQNGREGTEQTRVTKGGQKNSLVSPELPRESVLRRLLDVLSLFKPLTRGPGIQGVARKSWNILTYRVRTTRPRNRVQSTPDRGERLFRLPLTNIEVRIVNDLIFPRAPSWSPARHWRLPKLVLAHLGERVDVKPRRFSLPLWSRNIGLWRVSLHRVRLFPMAPRISPLSRLDASILKIHLKQKPRSLHQVALRPALKTLSRFRRELSLRENRHIPQPIRQPEQRKHLTR